MSQIMSNIPIKQARIKTKSNSISLFWLIPMITLIIISWIAWKNYSNHGTIITIDFKSAEGIIADRTYIRFKGIIVGIVKDIKLEKNCNIHVCASIKPSIKDALRTETKFWLVTPKVSLQGISGLDTLISGNYISMIPGIGKPRSHFIALSKPPKYQLNNNDLLIHLHSPELGSLNNNSLVFFRKIPVGRVYDYSINPNNKEVIIDILIEKRFSYLVKKDSRFWNTSGITANFSLTEAKLKLDNVIDLIDGGAIAFDSVEHSKTAQQGDEFILYEDLLHSRRGVTIQLILSTRDGLKAGLTPLIYKGMEVGKLTKMTLTSKGIIIGEMIVDPNVVSLLRDNTRIELYHPELSFTNLNLSHLFTGTMLQLVPGTGKPRYKFAVVPINKLFLNKSGVFTFQIYSSDSYGIDIGQPLTLHGVQIGKILERKLTKNGVLFCIAIDSVYKNILHSDTKFIANNRVNIEIGLHSIVIDPNINAYEWIKGRGIFVVPGKIGKIKKCYFLYENLENALTNRIKEFPITNLTLCTTTLNNIQIGSIVLYRKFKVGEVIAIRPNTNMFDIDIYIQPEYYFLISKNSVFWSENEIKMRFNTTGLVVDSMPLSYVLQGSIHFDNINIVNNNNNNTLKNQKHILYSSEIAAHSIGKQITLHIFDTIKLNAGIPIRYLGVDVGQIQNLKLIPERHEVQATALLRQEYVRIFARSGTRFSIVMPKISFSLEPKYIETILHPYISIEPGKGAPCYNFQLNDETIKTTNEVSSIYYLHGLNIIVEAPEVSTLEIGSPILFRGIKVGTVTGLSLDTSLSDHIILTLHINDQYQHLVRTNSVFWLISNYTLNFSLTKGIVKMDTLNRFIYGSIAFSTPPTNTLMPQAKSGQHFSLQKSEPRGWREWKTIFPQL